MALRISLEFGHMRAKMIAAGLGAEDLPPAAEVPLELSWVWRAWHRLHDDRPWIGGGLGAPVPGRIPWLAICEWCKFHGYNRRDTSFLDRCFAVMDLTYMEHWRMKNPLPTDKANRWGRRGN